MGPIEITLIIVCVLIVVGVFGTMIYKKAKGEPTCDCGCGGHKGKRILKAYKKKYGDKPKESGCCCCHCQEEVKTETEETSTCCCHDKAKDE